MPRYADPSLPSEVEHAVRMLGINRIRLGIILTLARADDLTTAAIAEAIDATKVSVGEHLRDLEGQGAVAASRPAGPDRRRAALTWRLNRAAVEADLFDLLKAVSPSDHA